MKKFKSCKLLMVMLAVITVFAVSLNTVSAAVAPSSINVKRAEVLSDLVTNHDHGFTIFTTTEGQIIYCLDNLKTRLDSGMSASLSGTADAGVQYILENGYPNKRIMDNGEADKYITQAAIWWYMEETGQGDNKLSNEFKTADKTDIYKLIPTYIKPMVANAKKAKANNTKPSMVVSGSNKFNLTSDKKYYETDFMTAKLTLASTYKVSINGATKDTKIVDKDGNEKTSFKSGEQFKVIVPAKEIDKNVTMTINFEASGSVQKAKIYSTGNSKYQRVVGLYDEVTPLKDNIKVSIEPKEELHICEIIDDTYYGKAGNIVDKATFDKECGEEVVTPNTSANVSPLVVAGGLLLIVAGSGVIAYRTRKGY